MNIPGNADIRRSLHAMAVSGRIPHALMFYENDGGGAIALVLEFLSEVFGGNPKVPKLIHPDIHFVFPVTSGSKVSGKVSELVSDQFLAWWRELVLANPWFCEEDLSDALGIEGKQAGINVSEARSILSKLSLTPIEGGYQAVVMYLPERMNVQAANRLLKIVEEPPQKTLFLFITHSPEAVLSTIVSRCQGLRVLPLTREERAFLDIPTDGEDGVCGEIFVSLMEALASHDLPAALDVGETLAALESREKQKAFLKYAGGCLRSIFLLQQKLPSLADLPQGDMSLYLSLAARLKKTFPRKALALLDRCSLLLDRNVSQKMLFCDMVDRMYLMN